MKQKNLVWTAFWGPCWGDCVGHRTEGSSYI